MKKIIWNILHWFDSKINHTIVDWLFDQFDCENEDGLDSLSYRIWEKTSYAYCCWVNDTLYDKWNIEEN